MHVCDQFIILYYALRDALILRILSCSLWLYLSMVEVHMVRANLENMYTMLIRIEDIGQSLLPIINNIGWKVT